MFCAIAFKNANRLQLSLWVNAADVSTDWRDHEYQPAVKKVLGIVLQHANPKTWTQSCLKRRTNGSACCFCLLGLLWNARPSRRCTLLRPGVAEAGESIKRSETTTQVHLRPPGKVISLPLIAAAGGTGIETGDSAGLGLRKADVGLR